MLADEILAPNSLSSMLEGSKIGAQFLRDSIRRAQRFELSENFTATVDLIVTENPNALKEVDRVIEYARPPYDYCWFECAYADRKKSAARPAPTEPDLKVPKRVGVLIQLMDPENLCYMMTLCWSFHHGNEEGYAIQIAPLAHFFDLSAGQSPIVKLLARQKPTRENILREIPDLTEEEIKLHMRLSSFFGWNSLSLYWSEILGDPMQDQTLDWAERIDKTAWRNQQLAASQGDWLGEPQFWLVALAFMQIRNAVTLDERPVPEKLNKARLRAKKEPLVSFTTCRLSERIMPSKGLSAAAMRAGIRHHFVRGHFKVRKSGLWWWSFFWR